MESRDRLYSGRMWNLKNRGHDMLIIIKDDLNYTVDVIDEG